MLTLLQRLFPLLPLTFLMTLISISITSHAKDTYLTAKESDSQTLGWMQGFPPPDDKLITQPSSNFFSFPKLRWTVCHIRELMPTTEISRGIGSSSKLSYALDKNIDALTFIPTGSNRLMTWQESLDANYTDGIMILHHGKVVYERQNGCLNELGKHAAMSMTKSMTGLLAEILVTEGKLDDKALVASIIPELANSGFCNGTASNEYDHCARLQRGLCRSQC